MAKIAKIEKLEDSEQQCIYVSSKDHLYITDDKICTHNTIISAVISEMTMFTENGWSPEKIYTFFTKLRKRIDSRMKGNYYGRAQPLDSLVLMSDNTFKKIKDVNPGDKVLTPNEGVQTVISKTEPTLQKCFELEFEDGRKVKCSPDHLWKVSFRKDDDGNKIWEVVTLQFIIDHPEIDFDFYH